MSVTRTFTVTVVSTGSGNKYFIDGVQTPTLELVEGATFRFDQSDYTNATHPLRFATAADAAGGTQYTTNVTTNGTPGSSGAYTQIEVASGAPTLYYYCTNHGGMGGQANTPNSDFWGAGNWSANRWGIEEAFAVGWGAQSWDDGEWGNLADVDITLTGLSSTSSLGSPTITTEINTGWGQDGWGVENWGESGQTVVIVSGVEATTGSGEDISWGKQTWDSATTNWGGNEYLLVPEDVMGLTGLGSTSSVGSPTVISNATFSLTGQSSTSSVGSIDLDAQTMGVTGLSSTSSVGAIAPADIMGLSGFGTTSSLGSVTTTGGTLVNLDGQSATASVGSISPADVMGVTGVSSTVSLGTASTTSNPLVIPTGQSATVSIAAFGTSSGFGIQAYSNVDTGSNSSYTDVATGSNTSYTDAA